MEYENPIQIAKNKLYVARKDLKKAREVLYTKTTPAAVKKAKEKIWAGERVVERIKLDLKNTKKEMKEAGLKSEFSWGQVAGIAALIAVTVVVGGAAIYAVGYAAGEDDGANDVWCIVAQSDN